MQVDAGAGLVVGVDKDNQVFTRVESKWIPLPRKMKHVTIGPAGLWGVTVDNYIYKNVGCCWSWVPGKNNYNNNIWNCGLPIDKVCM